MKINKILQSDDENAIVTVNFKVLKKACKTDNEFNNMKEMIEKGSKKHFDMATDMIIREILNESCVDYESYFKKMGMSK